MQLLARVVVNSAGLQAASLAAWLAGLEPAHIPRLHLTKGSYFARTEHAPFSRLICSVPKAGGWACT